MPLIPKNISISINPCILKKKIAILGSTGSIGRQTLKVISEHKDYFDVEVLTALNNYELLIKQASEFKPNAVVIGNEDHYSKVSDALDKLDIKVYAGDDAISQVVEMESIDQVMMAIVGFAGLKPTLAAIKNKKQLALANKESLVVAGHLISKAVLENHTPVIPVDSELSALFQCLMGEFNNPVQKITLTASGGPFRGMTIDQLKNVKSKQALQHPIWNMGDKVTIDSATLMNKGLEAIEAFWLFNLTPEQIDVVVHPQSIVHSMVHFSDGSAKAQMSMPDMHIPVQFAMSYPNRLISSQPALNLTSIHKLTFEKPDIKIFRNLALAFEALEKGGNLPCILNAANEIAVQAFLKDEIGFLNIPGLVEKCMLNIDFVLNPSLNELIESDRLTRIKATEFIKALD